MPAELRGTPNGIPLLHTECPIRQRNYVGSVPAMGWPWMNTVFPWSDSSGDSHYRPSFCMGSLLKLPSALVNHCSQASSILPSQPNNSLLWAPAPCHSHGAADECPGYYKGGNACVQLVLRRPNSLLPLQGGNSAPNPSNVQPSTFKRLVTKYSHLRTPAWLISLR